MTTQRIGTNRIADNAITASKLAPGAVPSGAPSHVANSAAIYANGAFVRANNSLNANTGGTVDGNLIITGNLTVQGTEFITQTSTLAIMDNMIYLNNPTASTITNAVGNGTYVIYTTQSNHGYEVGLGISVSGVTPSSFDIASSANLSISNVTSNTFTVASSVTDTYVSGGTARARTASNPDLGFAGGYNDGSYAHAGLFRDASDGIFKFFYNYTPEPDTSPYIDTNDASFRIANLRANLITDVLTVRGIDPLTRANSAYNHANSSFNKANIATVMFVAVSDETTSITTGTAKVTFRAPYAMTITNVRASLSTTSSSGNVSLTIKENGTSILNGRVWITAGEKTSTTSTTIPSIADGAIADDAEITIDIDDAGSGAKGLKVAMIYTV